MLNVYWLFLTFYSVIKNLINRHGKYSRLLHGSSGYLGCTEQRFVTLLRSKNIDVILLDLAKTSLVLYDRKGIHSVNPGFIPHRTMINFFSRHRNEILRYCEESIVRKRNDFIFRKYYLMKSELKLLSVMFYAYQLRGLKLDVLVAHDVYLHGALNLFLYECEIEITALPKSWATLECVDYRVQAQQKFDIHSRKREATLRRFLNQNPMTSSSQTVSDFYYLPHNESVIAVREKGFEKILTAIGSEPFNAHGTDFGIVALQSFVDSSFIWGNDGYSSHEKYFIDIISVLNDKGLLPIIQVHPNTLSGVSADAPESSIVDYKLTVNFLKNLVDNHVNFSISPGGLQKNINCRYVASRWGTIIIEALLDGKNTLFSKVSPISSLIRTPMPNTMGLIDFNTTVNNEERKRLILFKQFINFTHFGKRKNFISDENWLAFLDNNLCPNEREKIRKTIIENAYYSQTRDKLRTKIL